METHARPGRPARRSVLCAMAAAGATGILSGCAGFRGSSDAPPGERLYTWISNENDRAQWEAFIEAARTKDPQFSLELEGPSFEDYWTKAKTRMSARDAPALLTTQAARTQELGPLLAPLDDLAAQAGVDLSVFNEAMRTAMTVDGTLRAIPYDAEPMVLFFNRGMFTDAGLEPPGETFTTAEFLEDAKVLTRDGVHGAAISSSLVQMGMAIGFANGGAPVADGALTLTDPRIVDGIQFTFDLVTTHRVAAAPSAVDSEPAAQQALMNRQTAMYVDGPWMYEAYAEALGEDLGMAIIPSDAGEPRGMIQGSGFGIASNAEDPAAAFDTIAALTAPQVIGAVSGSRGTFPSLVGEEDEWARGKSAANATAVTAMAHHGEPLVTTSNWNEIISQFGQYATDGFRGKRSAEQILGDIQEATAR